ncbi:MAG: DNA translocase FtsK [Clostridiales bacterium]|nr:DNA translocase FtsK [Clostridiales bacterium]
MLIAMGIILFVGFLNIKIGVLSFMDRIFVGFFGAMAVFIPLFLVLCGVYYISNRGRAVQKSKLVQGMLLIILMSSIISIGDFNRKDYINMGLGRFFVTLIKNEFGKGAKLAGGGFIGNMVSYPLILTFGEIGTIIIFIALSVICLVMLTNITVSRAFSAIVSNTKKFCMFIMGLFRKKDNVRNVVRLRTNDLKRDIEFKGKLLEENEKEKKPEEKDKKDRKFSFGVSKDADANKGKGKSKDEDDFAVDIATCDDVSYTYPTLKLLSEKNISHMGVKDQREIALRGAKKLEETLESFGVVAKVINISKGPAITRYELQPNTGVKVSKILNLSDDIALNLATTGIRIEAPIPGKAAVGIEVPNKESLPVLIREVLDSEEFRKNKSNVAFALGKDVSGENIIADIAKMPHMLIAGATGSGKSVCINSIIISLLYKSSPEDVRILMIDPKVVELGIYNGIPHLLIPVVTDAKKASGALTWAVNEMVNRYKMFAQKGVRDIKGYNANLDPEKEEKKLPQIVIIIDELADLMMVAPHEVEDAICRLAQMARAAGMHLVIATQRPSVDVITGVIKANIPSRIAFSVSSQVDSRTIIDMSGAEKLLGKGDMLYFPVGEPKPIRVKGVFVSDKEVERVVEFIKNTCVSEYDDGIIDAINNSDNNKQDKEDSEDSDELIEPAMELVVGMGQASTSLLQRKLKVGYARAARIIDELEEKGVIGEYEGSKPRQVNWNREILAEYQMAKSSNRD